ncbi:MAG: GTP 3',8-cyclase MoaA [Pseudobdellovibrionaceae bacterium]
MTVLTDAYGRQFKYLRLSLTDKCNFRCSYCLPNGYQGCNSISPLNLNEIENLATAFAKLGVEKIRITGGEPTLRTDLIDIIAKLKTIPGIKTVALTTNAFRLKSLLEPLKESGLDGVNISLDSLDPRTFKLICGSDKALSIQESIDDALNIGFPSIKINAVLLKGLNDHQFPHFLKWIQTRPVTVRYIELMRTSDNHLYFSKHHLPIQDIQNSLLTMNWKELQKSQLSGPAREYTHPDYAGRVGFISPYDKAFCSSCNRLRVSSTGGLRLCLFGQGDLSLRHLLQDSKQSEELIENINTALRLKPKAHRLHENISGDMASLSAIGG